MAPKPEKEKVRHGPETQTLCEVMTLREEKTELQEKILSAQKKINSLKADLQAQETQEHTLDDFCHEEVTAHLLEFQDRVMAMNKDLTMTETTIATMLRGAPSLQMCPSCVQRLLPSKTKRDFHQFSLARMKYWLKRKTRG